MKISIVYVSESGNTEKVAGFIRAGAERVPDTEVRLFNLAKPETVDEALRHVIPARKANLFDANKSAIEAGKNYEA